MKVTVNEFQLKPSIDWDKQQLLINQYGIIVLSTGVHFKDGTFSAICLNGSIEYSSNYNKKDFVLYNGPITIQND